MTNVGFFTPAMNEKLPFTSVMAPVCVPSTRTVAPGSGSPFSSSTTPTRLRCSMLLISFATESPAFTWACTGSAMTPKPKHKQVNGFIDI